MEVVQFAHVTWTELVVEDGIVVEAAEGVLAADVREDLLNACSRARTAWRSASVFVGDSIDWQMRAADQTNRAVELPLKSSQRR